MVERREPVLGSIYGELTVIGPSVKCKTDSGRGYYRTPCRCSCGAERMVRSEDLRQGRSKTCNNKLIHRGYADRTQPAFNFLYDHVYKGRAVKRGLTFDLSKEQFKILTQSNCHYCGLPPATVAKQNSGDSSYVYTGVDRKDNDLGYTTDNVVPCCAICNHAKHTMGYEQFKSWIAKAYKFMEL